MRVLPRTPAEQVSFFERHLPVWGQDPTAVGLTQQQLDELTILTQQARAALDAAQAARNQARGATAVMHEATAKMMGAGSDAIASIKLVARGNADIYADAQIQAPVPATPAAAPVAPSYVHAVVSPEGRVTLSWKALGPTGTQRGVGARGGAGTSFIITRKVTGESSPSIIGITSELSFTDRHAPLTAGAYIDYAVRTRRGRRESEQATHATVLLPALQNHATTAAAPPHGRRAA